MLWSNPLNLLICFYTGCCYCLSPHAMLNIKHFVWPSLYMSSTLKIQLDTLFFSSSVFLFIKC